LSVNRPVKRVQQLLFIVLRGDYAAGEQTQQRLPAIYVALAKRSAARAQTSRASAERRPTLQLTVSC